MIKIFAFASLAILAVAAPAAAQDLRGQLSRCLAIPGVLQRLACYDGVAKGSGAAAPQQYQPQASYVAPAAPVPRYVPPTLGNERLPQSSPNAPQQSSLRLTAGIVKFENTLRGQFILTLSNGQVWRQIDGDTAIARPRPSARTVTIERAVFNSYSLTFNDAIKTYKVTRVQ